LFAKYGNISPKRQDFEKYLKESKCYCSNELGFSKYFEILALINKLSTDLSDHLAGTLRAHGLTCQDRYCAFLASRFLGDWQAGDSAHHPY